MKADAAAAGVSQGTIATVLAGVGYDPSIVRRDRARGVFAQDFLTFSGRMVSTHRMQHGAKRLKTYASTFRKIAADAQHEQGRVERGR
jgi:membrane-bound lytic murein transglycosylase B